MGQTCKTCAFYLESTSGPTCSGCFEADDFPKWTPSSEAPALLTAAQQHMQDRAGTYDKQDGERSMARTVAVFNSFHDLGMTEAQGWHFMQILKDVRLFSNPDYPHRDSIEDGIAYSALKGEEMLNG